MASFNALEARSRIGPVERSCCHAFGALHGRLGGRDEPGVAYHVARGVLLVTGRGAVEVSVNRVRRPEAICGHSLKSFGQNCLNTL